MSTYSTDQLPDTSGRNLGSDSQRWNLFAQTVDLAGGNGLNSFKYAQTIVDADGVLVPRSGSVVLTSAVELALTLETPVAGDEDGLVLSVWSVTAAPHVITLVSTGAMSVAPFNDASATVATFSAAVANSLTLEAYQGNWYVRSSTGVTLS